MINFHTQIFPCVSLLLLCIHDIKCDSTEEYCDLDDSYNSQYDNADDDPSFCQEVITHDNQALYNQDDYNILAALGLSVLNKTYPSRLSTTRSFAVYDEMPYPVPTGATSFFMVFFTVIFTWYFGKFIHWLLQDTAATLNLFPTTDHFPNVNIYMLQQSRRESRLCRDVRNTWAWLATYYLLKPSDTLVNPDEVFKTQWADFKVPHDVWGIIRAVLRVNALHKYAETKKQSHTHIHAAGETPLENFVREVVSNTNFDDHDFTGEDHVIHRRRHSSNVLAKDFEKTASEKLAQLKSTYKGFIEKVEMEAQRKQKSPSSSASDNAKSSSSSSDSNENTFALRPIFNTENLANDKGRQELD